MKKPITLTVISTLLLAAFFLLPQNRVWFSERIVGYWNDFRQQRKQLDLEQRKKSRWGRAYTVSQQVAALLPPGAKKDALVLVPPTAYFEEKQFDYHVPEPAVFYYYTGVKTTWINSRLAPGANWLLMVRNGKLSLERVLDKEALIDSLADWKKYPVSL